MQKIHLLLLILILTGCLKQDDRVNVLFISVDDMNDWVGFLDGYEGEVYTPYMDSLAASGLNFVNAHCPSPVCNPSRTAILTGLMPYSSGIYGNDQWWKPNLPEAKSLPMLFKENGYLVNGAGKIFHHTAGFNPPDQWDHFQDQVFDDPWSHNRYYPFLSDEKPSWFPGHNLDGKNRLSNFEAFDWKALDKEDYEMGDGQAVNYGMGFLNQSHDQPFFLAIGIYRPHIPWYFPKKYIDYYPIDQVKVPDIVPSDLDDIPAPGKEMAMYRYKDLEILEKTDNRKKAVQAYLSSITYADKLIGDLLEALGNSKYAKNTLVVLWSDHGWHHGEKMHLHKSTLWQRATRVPFLIAGPGITPQLVGEAVNLVDIYPTLAKLCRLEDVPHLDGESLVPFFKEKGRVREKPSVTVFGKGNYAVCDERYRLIRYWDKSEELYDHAVDPEEINNLSGDSSYADIARRLGKWIPAFEKEEALKKGAFDFDLTSYTWTHKSDN